jgi:hypothetical protein
MQSVFALLRDAATAEQRPVLAHVQREGLEGDGAEPAEAGRQHSGKELVETLHENSVKF